MLTLQSECVRRQPYGREIYRKGTISLFEVDGKDHKVFLSDLILEAISEDEADYASMTFIGHSVNFSK